MKKRGWPDKSSVLTTTTEDDVTGLAIDGGEVAFSYYGKPGG
jgi:hypothetical protein